jgi:hypothetical protein
MIRYIFLILLVVWSQVFANEPERIDCTGFYADPMGKNDVSKYLFGKTNLLDELDSELVEINNVGFKVFRASSKIFLAIFELDGYSNFFIVEKLDSSLHKKECLVSNRIQAGSVKDVEFSFDSGDLIITMKNFPKGTGLSMQKVKYKYHEGRVNMGN